MGRAYDKEFLPTKVQQLERQYPAYATSTPRLKVIGARITAKVGSIQTMVHEQVPSDIQEILDMVEKVLIRITEEGPNPVYDEMVAKHKLDPLGV